MEITIATAGLLTGEYYVGDPCYAVPDRETWDKILNVTNFFKDSNYFAIGSWVGWAHSTAFGDGLFRDQSGWTYGVDSGLIGCIPIEAVKRMSEEYGGPTWEEVEKNLDEVGAILTLPKYRYRVQFSPVYYEEYGAFDIGDVTIDTHPDEDDWNDEEWVEDEEEDE